MNRKKLSALVLSAILMLALVACTPNNSEPSYPPVSLSSDLFSFEFGLNGHKYTLPADYQEFYDNNWALALSGSWDDTLKPDEFFEPVQILFDGKDSNSSASLFNSTDAELAPKECKIATFTVKYSATSYVPYIELPKGITMKSTYEDVIAAYGEPDSESKETVNKLSYYIDEYTYVNISIDTGRNSIHEITLVNYLSDYEIGQ